jgi:hypothetical protein
LTRCRALQDDHGFVGRFAHSFFTESYWREAPIGDYFFKKRFERNNNRVLLAYCVIIEEKWKGKTSAHKKKDMLNREQRSAEPRRCRSCFVCYDRSGQLTRLNDGDELFSLFKNLKALDL